MELRVRESVKMLRQWQVDSEIFSLRALENMVVLLTEMMGVDLGVRNNHGTSS